MQIKTVIYKNNCSSTWSTL